MIATKNKFMHILIASLNSNETNVPIDLLVIESTDIISVP